MTRFGKVGLIGRFKPLHLGSASMLEVVCENSENVIIGIGSINKYNLRNPFTADESRNMIDIFLSPKFSNYEFIFIPDYGHKTGNENMWVNHILSAYKNLDTFVSGNEYVKKILSDHYKIIDPFVTYPKIRNKLRASMVRQKMAIGNGWKNYVPDVVTDYIIANKLDERFRKEFGKEVILLNHETYKIDSFYEEKNNVLKA